MSTIALKDIVGSSLGSLQLEDADAGIGSCELSSFLIHTSCVIWVDFNFIFMDAIQRYGYVEVGIYRIAALIFCPRSQLIPCSIACSCLHGFYLDLIRFFSGDACRNALGTSFNRFIIVKSKLIRVGEMSFPNQSGRTIYLDIEGCS